MLSQENKIIIDWVSITSKQLSVDEMKDLLGLQTAPWIEGNGYHGYHKRIWYDSISIHYDGGSNMGIWLEMSGQGCRAFESYSDKRDIYNTEMYAPLFKLVVDNPKEYNITRLDVAFDEFTGILDPARVVKDTQERKFKSRAEYWSSTVSSDGMSVNVGSPRSKVVIRIYDKRAERLAKIEDRDQRERISEDIPHWMRVELQLRDERALEFIKTMAGCGKCNDSGEAWPIGIVYTGVLKNYLDYGYPVRKKGDAEEMVWHTYDYWQDVLCGASAISIYTQPGTEYNLARLTEYVINMAGNAVDALIDVEGFEGFLEALKTRRIKPNPKYTALVAYEKEKRDQHEEFYRVILPKYPDLYKERWRLSYAELYARVMAREQECKL